MSDMEIGWAHTPGASGGQEDSHFVDHCIDCSDAASEWVSWPCSATALAAAAVAADRYLRAMDDVSDCCGHPRNLHSDLGCRVLVEYGPRVPSQGLLRSCACSAHTTASPATRPNVVDPTPEEARDE